MKKIAFLEFEDEYDALVAYARGRGVCLDEIEIVAVGARLQCFLVKRNQRFRTTLPYFDNSSHREIILETEKVMEIIRKECLFQDGHGLSKCYVEVLAYYLRLYLNHILMLVEIVSNAYDACNDVEMYAYQHNQIYPSCLISDSERYLGTLVKRFCSQKKLGFNNICPANLTSQPQSIRKRRHSLWETLAARVALSLVKKRKVIFVPRLSEQMRHLASTLSRKSKDIVFLSIDYSGSVFGCIVYNLMAWGRACLDTNYPRNYRLDLAYLHKKPNKAEVESLESNLEDIFRADKRDVFKYRCVEYYDVVCKKVDLSFKQCLVGMLAKSHNLRHLRSVVKRHLVMSYSAMGVMSLAGEMERVQGGTSVFVSHGIHPVPVDRYHELELYNLCKGFMLGEYTHIALATPIQEQHLHYFKRMHQDITSEEIRTGPLIFADTGRIPKDLAKRRIGFQERDIVLTHATTTKRRWGQRFYFIETTDEYFSSLSDIIRFVNLTEGVRLVVKLHPGWYLTDEEMQSLLPKSDKYTLLRETPFHEVLSATDILISYSSTAIDEAMLNRIPVVLYDKWDRYNHYGAETLSQHHAGTSKPVYYVNNPKLLEATLSHYIAKADAKELGDIDYKCYVYQDDYSERFGEFICSTV